MNQSGPERLRVMVYRRVLKLPCDNIRNGIGFKAMLDTALKQMVEVLFKASDGFKIDLDDHTGGHLRAVITRGAQKFEVEGCYGQNSSFAEGKKVSFVSYTVRAEGSLGTGGQAGASENTELAGKVAGVVIAVALVCALMSPILKSSKFIYCVPVLVLAAWAGRWFGIRATRTLTGATEASATTQAAPTNDNAQGKALWKRLTHAIESVTSEYPTA